MVAMRYDVRTSALSVLAILSVAGLASAQVRGSRCRLRATISGRWSRSTSPGGGDDRLPQPQRARASGEDRTGKIWEPWCPTGWQPWGRTCGTSALARGSQREHVFSVSHDVEIEGARLPAGKYGLHFIPGAEQWTVIFSKNATSWGSYFYDAREDALRVVVKPARFRTPSG